MAKHIRQIGILLTAIGCVFFIAGGITDHWAKSGPHHYGLWSLCRNVTSQNYSSQINASALDSTISTTFFPQDHTEKETEEKEEDVLCEGFSFSEISGNI